MSPDDVPPPLGLTLRFTWCRAGDHLTCPGVMGNARCDCDCHLAQAAA